MIKLLGFAPDMETPTPGVITSCSNLIPFVNGMQAAPTNVTPTDAPALAASCTGAAVVTLLSGARRIIAGTTTALYELTAGSWVDVTRGTGAYTGGSDTRLSFCQFGNATIVSNKTDAMQRSVTSGAFADIAGAPRAEVVFSVGSFVMALNVNDGADKQDGWHCCASFDETDWVENIATQSASGRLVDTPGILTAGLRLGDYAVAYKKKSIYLGQYVGAPAIWDWILIPGGEAGCIGKEAICDIGGAHFFVGDDNIWIFDGSKAVPVAENIIRQWFFDNSNPAARYKTKCVFDQQTKRVWIFYPSTASDTCDSAIVYHTISQQWGVANRSVEAALAYVSSGVTYDTLNTEGATYDTLPNISYDSQYWLNGGNALAVFNTSHQLQLVNGAAGSSTFTTGDAGDDYQVSLLTGVRLRFSSGMAPSSATMQAFSRMNVGDNWTTGRTTTIDDGKFDVFQEARWHKAAFSLTGDTKITHIMPQLRQAGER